MGVVVTKAIKTDVDDIEIVWSDVTAGGTDVRVTNTVVVTEFSAATFSSAGFVVTVWVIVWLMVWVDVDVMAGSTDVVVTYAVETDIIEIEIVWFKVIAGGMDVVVTKAVETDVSETEMEIVWFRVDVLRAHWVLEEPDT
jgi:hypothetical protein